MSLGGVIAAAIAAFASTNIDDALVLVVYFANAAEGRNGFRRRHVWIGQIVGFTVIVVVSVVGVFLGSLLPPHYAGLLGFVPLLIGLWRTREWCEKGTTVDEDDNSDCEASSITKSDSISSSAAERDIEPALLASPRVHEEPYHAHQTDVRAPSRTRWMKELCSVHALRVAAVTVASGGDNVATYIPLLITYSAGEVVLTVVIFYALLAVWISVAGALASFRVVATTIERFGRFIIPIALILLGLYILWSADVMSLI